MRIISVEATNFRAFGNISWKLPKAGLTLIDAVSDTGRSNMAGKTSLLDSIFWCIYTYLPKWGGPKGGPADGVIKRGFDKCSVTTVIEQNGSTIKIHRERPNKVRLWVDNKEIHGKSADLDDRIEQLIGHTAAQFLLGIYISQDRKSSFYTMSDAERTALLSVVAGLEELDKGLADAKAKRDVTQTALDKIEGSLNVLEGQLNELPSQIETIQSDLSSKEQDLLSSQQDYALASKTFSQIESQLNDRLGAGLLDLQSSRDDNLSILHSDRLEQSDRYQRLAVSVNLRPELGGIFLGSVSEAQASLQAVQTQNKAQEKLRQRNEKRREDIEKAINQAEKAQEGKCQSCKQDLPVWDKEIHAQKFIEQAQNLASQIEEETEVTDEPPYVQALEVAQAAMAKAKAELEAQPNQIKLEMKSIQSEIDLIDSQIKTINLQFQSDKGKLEAESVSMKAEANQLLLNTKAVLNNIENLYSQAKAKLDTLLKSEAGLKASVEEYKVKTFTLTKDLNEQLDLIELFGPKGFRSVCFDGLIERIGQRAGQLFALMTDGLYSTRLDQVGEDSKGSQKLILKPIIIKGGQEVISDDLSGGARRMAMIAYDVAVSEAIDDESPLLLDEALDGLDTVGKAEAMRLLEEIGRTRPVYVIDHSSEFKSSFGQVLTVVHKNGNSELKEN